MPIITKICIRLTPKMYIVFIAPPMHVQFVEFLSYSSKFKKRIVYKIDQ